MRNSASAMALALSMVFLPASAMATELRVSHFVPPDHDFDKEVHVWAKALEDASGGEIKVTVFPAGQLGAPTDHFDMARDGIADVAWVNWGYTPGAFPVLELIDLPFAIDADRPTAARAVHNWFAPHAAKEMPDVRFCLAHVGPPGTLHSTTPIAVPADVKGLKVRPSGGAMAQYVADLGGSAVQVAGPEVRGALERGMANAITFPWQLLTVFGVADAVTYHIDNDLYYVGAGLVINQARYDGLSDKAKAAVDSVCNADWAEKLGRTWVENENAGRDLLEAKGGHTFHKLTEDELKTWRASTEPAYARWAKLIEERGHDPVAIRSALDEAVAAARAK